MKYSKFLKQTEKIHLIGELKIEVDGQLRDIDSVVLVKADNQKMSFNSGIIKVAPASFIED